MTQGNKNPNRFINILGSAVLATLIAIATLLWEIYSSGSQDVALRQQLAFQATSNAITSDQLEVLSKMATLQADPRGFDSTATYIAQEIQGLDSTAVALSTEAASIPFQDTFSDSIRPEWRFLSGDILIQDGWLSAARDMVVLEIGDDSITDLTLSFDYRNLRGVNEIMITFDQKVRLVIGQDGSGWQALVDNTWIDISLFEGVRVSGQLSVNVIGNTYRVLRNQEPVQETTYGTPVGGPIMMTVVADRFIDNFYLARR